MIEKEEQKVKKERGGGRKGGFGSRWKVNLKVSTSETWFPELERVLSSEKEEYFFQRSPEPPAPGRPELTLHGRMENPVPHWLCRAGCRACQRPQEDPEVCFLLSLPFPARTWATMDTETLEQDAKPLPSPFCPLLPPFAECIVTIHVTK